MFSALGPRNVQRSAEMGYADDVRARVQLLTSSNSRGDVSSFSGGSMLSTPFTM